MCVFSTISSAFFTANTRQASSPGRRGPPPEESCTREYVSGMRRPPGSAFTIAVFPDRLKRLVHSRPFLTRPFQRTGDDCLFRHCSQRVVLITGTTVTKLISDGAARVKSVHPYQPVACHTTICNTLSRIHTGSLDKSCLVPSTPRIVELRKKSVFLLR